MEIYREPNWAMRLLRLLAIGAIPICAAANEVQPMQLAGYKPVPVRYVPLNKMIVSVSVNGHPANLLVDTGANQTALDADSAESFGVTPGQHRLRYIGYKRINGQLCPIAFLGSLTAGSMNFGSVSVALFTSNSRSNVSNRWPGGRVRVDGLLGTDILIRHAAVIDCREKFIFFKGDRSPGAQFASDARSKQFARIPLHREESGRLTVPCSIHGQSGRLFVDTGAFVTTFNEALFKSLGIALQPAHISGRFSDGVSRQYSIGQVNDLAIGDFKVPSTKFGAAAIPNFASQRSDMPINGILGMDFLFDCHAIIDFGSMNLFLK